MARNIIRHKISPNVEQWLGFMHLYITDGTKFAGFQVAHDTHLANCKSRDRGKKTCHYQMSSKRIS